MNKKLKYVRTGTSEKRDMCVFYGTNKFTINKM